MTVEQLEEVEETLLDTHHWALGNGEAAHPDYRVPGDLANIREEIRRRGLR